MAHVKDSELIKHVAGELPQPQRARVDEHVASCRHCRDRQRQISRTWRLLDDWRVEPLEAGLADAVSMAARREREAGFRQPTGWRKASLVLRAAAAILVAVGLGHLAARWTTPLPSSPVTGGVDRLAPSDEASAIPLGVLELGSATGWADLIVDMDNVVSSEEEG